jgi:hypothetical protein
MTKILVYHVKDTRALNERSLMSEIGDGMTPINFPENHELIASVETKSIDLRALDEAYRLTQNINHSWPLNPEVSIEIAGRNRFRSTHIGDVLVMGNDTYVCAPIGWEKVTSVDQKVRD